MQQVDLAIVGASFAGLACAQAAAARGVKTLVLERKPDPGASPHTTGLLVKEVADAWDIPRRLTRKIHGARLYGPNLNSLDLVSPGYYFLATDTPAVLRWLAEQAAETGAEIRCGVSYDGATRNGDGFQLAETSVNCRYLVGCDGARSRVARDFGLGQNRSLLTGVEVEYEGVTDLEEDRLHVFLDSQLAPGYVAWVVPGMGVAQVGLAVRQPRVPRINDFVAKIGRLFNFDGAKVIGRRAGVIPCGGVVRRFAGDRVMLLGDAAGMVSPLTAGGIHSAMGIARLAGVAISDYLLDGGCEPARVVRGITPGFHFKHLLRAVWDLNPPNWFYDGVLGTSFTRWLAQTIFFHHRGLFSVQAWKEILLAAR